MAATVPGIRPGTVTATQLELPHGDTFVRVLVERLQDPIGELRISPLGRSELPSREMLEQLPGLLERADPQGLSPSFVGENWYGAPPGCGDVEPFVEGSLSVLGYWEGHSPRDPVASKFVVLHCINTDSAGVERLVDVFCEDSAHRDIPRILNFLSVSATTSKFDGEDSSWPLLRVLREREGLEFPVGPIRVEPSRPRAF